MAVQQDYPQIPIYTSYLHALIIMLRGALGLFIILVILVPVAADVPLPPWSWNTYSGTNVWQVTVTESGCGEGAYTNKYSVPIQYNYTTAVMGNVGHGPAPGTFISGNILHIPGRTVSDPPGISKLSAYDVFFTTDCSSFAAKYNWVYSGPDGSCSGTTTMNGANSRGCPSSQVVPVIPTVAPASGSSVSSDLITARYDLTKDLTQRRERDVTNSLINAKKISWDTVKTMDTEEKAAFTAREQKIEGQYQAILDKDPANFFANMDMAELKKSQGKLDDYIRYVNVALSNKNVAESTANAIRQDIMAKNNLGEWPTPSNSYTIAMLGPDTRMSAQNVYGRDIRKDVTTGTSYIDNLVYIFTYNGPADLLNTVVLPGGGQK